MGMLFLAAPEHKLSKWRSQGKDHQQERLPSSSKTSYPMSPPDITMTVPSSSSSSPSNKRNKKTFHFILALGSMALVLVFLWRDERVLLLAESDDKVAATKELPVKSPKSNRTKASDAKDPKPIRQISILGERNSGTRWTYDHMHACFGHAVHVTKRFSRYKHWFQYPDASKYPHDTLVLAQFRNPYDWLKAMEHVPHHSPNHLRTMPGATVHAESAENDWKIFLTKPWTMERVGADLLLDPENATCQEDFRYRDIISCTMEPLPPSFYNWTQRYSEHQPFYEMRNDGSGLPYDNILELRADKIRNFLSTANYPGVADTWVIQYEYLLSSGTSHLVEKISEWTGIEPKCDPIPPQNRKQKKSRYVSPEFAAHVRKHLNWTVESWIGYEVDLQREEEQVW